MTDLIDYAVRILLVALVAIGGCFAYRQFERPRILEPTGKPREVHTAPPVLPKRTVPVYRGEGLPIGELELPDPSSIEATIAVAPDPSGELVQVVLRKRRRPVLFPEIRRRQPFSIETASAEQASLVTVVPNTVPLLQAELRFGIGVDVLEPAGMATVSFLNVRGVHLGAAASTARDVGLQLNLEALPRLHVTGAWWLRRNRPGLGLSYNL